jgi:gas vesicle protein
MEKQNRFGAMALGIFIGGAIGAIAMLLAAPKSGEQTRALLREKSGEIKKEVTTRVQDTRDRAGSWVTQIRDQSEQIALRISPKNNQFSEIAMDTPSDMMTD